MVERNRRRLKSRRTLHHFRSRGCLSRHTCASLGATTPLLLGLMYACDNWSPGAYTYLVLHGSYGMLWVVKSWLFGDPRWEKKLPPLGFLIMTTWLFMYWVGGIMLIVRGTPVSTERAALATAMYVFGVTAMLGADGQRHFTLRLKPGLISDGWYARTRNPNYLGEIMLYGSFGCAAARLQTSPRRLLAIHASSRPLVQLSRAPLLPCARVPEQRARPAEAAVDPPAHHVGRRLPAEHVVEGALLPTQARLGCIRRAVGHAPPQAVAPHAAGRAPRPQGPRAQPGAPELA